MQIKIMDRLLAILFMVLSQSLTFSHSQFLQSVSGDILAGNFTYYSLMHPGFIFLELTSTLGDCDIYVSQFKSHPTFEYYDYCLQSSTCGQDTIVLSKSFKRPLGIGIYGHPSHKMCSYVLNIYEIKEVSEVGYDLDELSITAKVSSDIRTEHDERARRDSANKESFLWVLFCEILESFIEALLF